MKRIILFGLIIFQSFNHSIAQSKLSLQDCIETALKNSPTVQRNRLLWENNLLQLKQAEQNRLPSVRGYYGHSLNFGRNPDPSTFEFLTESNQVTNANASAGVTVWNGGVLNKSILQARQSAEAGKFTIENAQLLIKSDVIRNFISTLSAQEEVQIAESQVNTASIQLERSRKQLNSGIVAEAGLYDLQRDSAQRVVALTNAQNRLFLAKTALFQSMNIGFDEKTVLENLPEDLLITGISLDNFFEKAKSNFPELKSTEMQIKAAETGIAVAKGGLMPNVSFGGNMGSYYSSSNKKDSYFTQLGNAFNYGLGFDVSIPIFRQFQQRNRITGATIQQKIAISQAEETKLRFRREVELLYAAKMAAENTYKANLSLENIAQKAFQAAENRFNAGTVSTFEYTIAKMNYDQARLSLVQSKYDLLLRKKLMEIYL